MIRKAQALSTILAALLLCKLAFGQSAPAPILQVDIENWVEYVYDTADASKWATNPDKTPAAVPKDFTLQIGIADIVAVNGQPVKGTVSMVLPADITHRCRNSLPQKFTLIGRLEVQSFERICGACGAFIFPLTSSRTLQPPWKRNPVHCTSILLPLCWARQ